MPTVQEFEDIISKLSGLGLSTFCDAGEGVPKTAGHGRGGSDSETEDEAAGDADPERTKAAIAQCFGDILPIKLKKKYGLNVPEKKVPEQDLGIYASWKREDLLARCNELGISRGLSSAKVSVIVSRLQAYDNGSLKGFGKYSELNIHELKALCSERDMRGYHNAKKEILIQKLKEWDSDLAESGSDSRKKSRRAKVLADGTVPEGFWTEGVTEVS